MNGSASQDYSQTLLRGSLTLAVSKIISLSCLLTGCTLDYDVTDLSAQNPAPQTQKDQYKIRENTSKTIYPLANDLGIGLEIIAVGTAQNGDAVLSSSESITYTPNSDFSGADEFSYTVRDQNGLTSQETIELDVTYCLDEALTDSPFANSSEPGIDGSSEATAFRICTPVQWNQIGSSVANMDKYFILKANLDMSSYDENNYNKIGDGTAFTGQIDGKNYEISNLSLDGGGGVGIGVVTSIGTGGVVKSIRTKNIQLSNAIWAAGGIAGYNSGLIENCHAEVIMTNVRGGGGIAGWSSSQILSVSAVLNYTSTDFTMDEIVGGIVGDQVAGALTRDCWASGSLSSPTGERIGGIAGNNNTARVENCYTAVSITAPDRVGGIVGRVENGGEIYNSFSASTISASTRHGPVYGHDFNGPGTYSEIYYDSTKGCVGCNTNGTAIDTSIQPSFFFDPAQLPLQLWDFTNTWLAVDGGYPELRDN